MTHHRLRKFTQTLPADAPPANRPNNSAMHVTKPALITLTLLITLLAGCSVLRTSEEADGSTIKEARVGHYYFLPKALISITGAKAAGGEFTITVARQLVADRRARYFLRWTQNGIYEDDIKQFKVNTDGLLTNVDVETTDKSGEAIKDLVQTTINAFRIAGRVPKLEKGGPATDEAGDLIPFKYVFDPLDANEVSDVKRRLRGLQHITLHISDEHLSVRSSVVADIGGGVAGDGKLTHESIVLPDKGGVFYRPPTVVDMRLEFNSDGRYPIVERSAVMVPDPDHVACYRFGRSPLVKRKTGLTLVAGMPSETVLNRPSPIQAGTTLLKDVSETVANAIPTLINVKTNRTKAELANEQSLVDAQKNLLTSQKGLTDAQKNLLTSQKELQDIQNPAPAGKPKDESVEKKKDGTPPGVAPPPIIPPPGPNPGTGDEAKKKPGAAKTLQVDGTITLTEPLPTETPKTKTAP